MPPKSIMSARFLQKHAPDAVSVLDLGCGTGRHALVLAERGFRVVGVDRSAQMLNRAQALRDGALARIQDRLSFHEFDIAKLRLGAQFDVVVALFHVMSYQTFPMRRSAPLLGQQKAHLRSQGIFFFSTVGTVLAYWAIRRRRDLRRVDQGLAGYCASPNQSY